MEKKKAIAKITLISILVALLLVFSIISFMPKNSAKGFAGFAGSITKGMDVEGGIYASYTPSKLGTMTDEEFKDGIDSTFSRINSLIEQKGYEDARVYLGSDNKIRIETANTDDAEEILSLIGSGEFKIKVSSSSSAETKISGKNVTAAFAMQDPSTYNWGTYIGFDETGAEALSSITASAGSSTVYLYFYRGDSENYFFSLSVSSQITNDFLFISSSTGSMTKEDAIDLAIQVSTGSFETVLSIDGNVYEISPSSGEESLLGITIAGAVAVLFILIIFGVVYRELGLMSILSILLFVGSALFFMQSIPVITLSVASLGAVLVGIILISSLHVILLEKIKSEYQLGKKLKTSIKTGYKKSIAIISEICGILAIISTVMYFICQGAMKSFSMIMIVCSILSIIITLFFTYHLNWSYSIFNPSNAKRVNFTREENVDEIE
ncbi:MAG: hypothetical protein ACI4L1_01565 [Christensenellales bacterium]